MKGKRLGEILVEKGILTRKTVDRVLQRAQRVGKRFGVVLEEMELITGEELAFALAAQYGFRVVTSFKDRSYPAELLSVIPVDVAMENALFPLKKEGNVLALAMSDPTNTRTVANIARNHSLTIVPVISTRTEISAAICRHYLGREAVESADRKVLLVDDDELVLSMLSGVLVREGYTVVTAPDGMEGYRQVIAEKPQVVITDKEMPKLDGFGLLAAMANLPETRLLPVILVSGKMRGDDEARAFEKGFFDYICKPVKEITLLTRLKRAFQFYDLKYRL